MDEQSQQAAIERLEKIPRLQLGFYPTPIQEMPRLRVEMGKNCPRIFIKRDDFTGFGFGGNKIRKLEFVFEKLLREGTEVVVTTGGERSNHARMTAFICAKLGLKCILVLDRKPRPAGTKNLKPAAIFLEEMLRAEVHRVDSMAERKVKTAALVAEAQQKGVKVYEIPLGGALAHGTLGFVAAMGEMLLQTKVLGIAFDHLFFASSTAGTHTGMLVGKQLFGLQNLRIVGISPEPNSAVETISEIKRLLAGVSKLLEIPIDDVAGEIDFFDEYAGEGYCLETTEANKAFKLLATTEAVLLDSVYTAKAMAGLFDWIKKGLLNENNDVLFWHTGGQLTQFYVPN